MSDTPSEKTFLEFILSSLLSYPDKIVITDQIDDLGLLFTVSVAEEDMGKLIGKNGQTIQSVRTILRMMGSKRQQRINLKVLEPVKAE